MAAHYAIDQPKGEQVVKKLEMVIRPLMGLVYFFQGLDKQCINYASVFSLDDPLAFWGRSTPEPCLSSISDSW